MKVTFCGAARTVTGSCYYIDNGNTKFLVDCGAFQGSVDLEKKNRDPFPFNPADLDFVFVTHAHFDHVGRLPLLIKQGFRGRIISTAPTKDLAKIVLLDAAKIQKEDYERFLARAKHSNKGRNFSNEGSLYENLEPLYTSEDVFDLMELFEAYPYAKSVKLQDDLEFRFRNAGHILGSASVELWVNNNMGRTRKLVFSGDLGQSGQRIIKDPDYIREADYVWIESTYGNRLHKSKDQTTLELLSIIKEAQSSNGNVLMPVFAVERAQEIIYELNLFYENKLVPSQFPVYLDSPMAQAVTEVFRKYTSLYDTDALTLLEKGDDPFVFQGFQPVLSVDQSKRLAAKHGVMIMAGSGMCTGGRITHHLINHGNNPNNHIVFVGYQVKGTLGRRIVDGEKRVRIRGQMVDIRAKVHTLGGFSAHADARDLRYWLRSFGHTPVKIFVVHGDEEIAVGFAQEVGVELKLDTYAPFLGETVTLE